MEKAVCRKVKGVRLLMVGEGELLEKAISLIRELGISDKVLLQPFRQDVPDVLAASDIFVLPFFIPRLCLGQDLRG